MNTAAPVTDAPSRLSHFERLAEIVDTYRAANIPGADSAALKAMQQGFNETFRTLVCEMGYVSVYNRHALCVALAAVAPPALTPGIQPRPVRPAKVPKVPAVPEMRRCPIHNADWLWIPGAGGTKHCPQCQAGTLRQNAQTRRDAEKARIDALIATTTLLHPRGQHDGRVWASLSPAKKSHDVPATRAKGFSNAQAQEDCEFWVVLSGPDSPEGGAGFGPVVVPRFGGVFPGDTVIERVYWERGQWYVKEATGAEKLVGRSVSCPGGIVR